MEEEYNNIGFKNADISYITSKSSYSHKNRMTSDGYVNKTIYRNETISTSPDGSSASKTKLKNKNEKSTSVFKQVNITPDGGVVLKNRNGRSSERNISRNAAKRKIKRLQRRQERMV
jgi:hypothetical protein